MSQTPEDIIVWTTKDVSAIIKSDLVITDEVAEFVGKEGIT